MSVIKICKDFTDTPGGRFRREGKYSGEEFRDEILFPRYEKAKKKREKLIIDFDGCFGFGTSFLEEAFGGLVRKHNKRGILNDISIISKEDETIPGNIKQYVEDAENNIQ